MVTAPAPGLLRIDRIGAEHATRPPIDAFRRDLAELPPPAEAAVAGVISWEQVRDVEPRPLRLPRRRTPPA